MQVRRNGKGDRLRVAVLMGGPSSEHDVSLKSGRKVVGALEVELFDVRPVVIDRDGTWHLPTKALRPADDRGAGWKPYPMPYLMNGWRAFPGPLPALCHLQDWPVDVVLPALHGCFGEDGTVQACLAAAGIAFVGSGHAASALAMDKVRTKEVLTYHGIRTPPFEELPAEDLSRHIAATADRLVHTYGTPLVLKDPCGGSSLEVRIADDAGAAAAGIQDLVPPARRLMVESFVAGRELTAGVIQDRETRRPTALPITEIRPKGARSYDYHEKYAADGAELTCPAPVPSEVAEEAQAIGLRVHELLGLAGLSRTDMILDADGVLQVLEVNTLPGMTETSLVPRAAAVAGLPFPALLETLIRSAAP